MNFVWFWFCLALVSGSIPCDFDSTITDDLILESVSYESTQDICDASFQDIVSQDRKDLELEIKTAVTLQMGLDPSSASSINLKDFDIENWPPFVPFEPKYWDDLSLMDLNFSIPQLVFKAKVKKLDHFTETRLKLFDLIIDHCNRPIEGVKGRTNKMIWSNYHISGWPRSVPIRVDSWTEHDFLVIYRNLNQMHFKYINDEQRIITYTDGHSEICSGPKVNHKRNSCDDIDIERSINWVKPKVLPSWKTKTFENDCKILTERILAAATSQLGASGKPLNSYEIENWPPFVHTNHENWDLQAYNDLKAAFPKFIFSHRPIEAEREKEYNRLRTDLIKLLLANFKRQTENASEKRMFHSHIKGWPQGVETRADRWDCLDILKIYRNIKRIKFKLKQRKEVRTISYDDEDGDSVEGTEYDLLVEPVNEIELDDATDDLGIEFNNLAEEHSDLFINPFIKYIESFAHDIEDGHDHMDDPITTSTKDYIFRKDCKILMNLIKSARINQLGALENPLSSYEIENWPPFVSINLKHWDQQAYNDLQAALPTLKFSHRLLVTKEENEYSRNRTELVKLLLAEFKRQTRNPNASNSDMYQSNPKGWPQGVAVKASQWCSLDLLKIYRNIDQIKFEPVLKEEKRINTYDNREVVYSKRTGNKRKRIIKPQDDEEDTDSEKSSPNDNVQSATISHSENIPPLPCAYIDPNNDLDDSAISKKQFNPREMDFDFDKTWDLVNLNF